MALTTDEEKSLTAARMPTLLCTRFDDRRAKGLAKGWEVLRIFGRRKKSPLLRRRRELAGSQDISKARRSTREVRMIGMVADVRTTKNGHRILELEDDSDRVPVLLPADSSLAAEAVVQDEVIGVVGTVNGKGLVIATSLVRPDIPSPKAFGGANGHAEPCWASSCKYGSSSCWRS